MTFFSASCVRPRNLPVLKCAFHDYHNSSWVRTVSVWAQMDTNVRLKACSYRTSKIRWNRALHVRVNSTLLGYRQNARHCFMAILNHNFNITKLIPRTPIWFISLRRFRHFKTVTHLTIMSSPRSMRRQQPDIPWIGIKASQRIFW